MSVVCSSRSLPSTRGGIKHVPPAGAWSSQLALRGAFGRVGQNDRVSDNPPSVLGESPPTAGAEDVEGAPDDQQLGIAVRLDPKAVDTARAAAIEEAGAEAAVGALVDAVADDSVAVSARFVATDRGYQGWHWSVTLAVLDAEHPTVSEVVLLPGPDALLAPAWIPWDQRIRSGDLGVGDLLPSAPDDPRLVPGYVQSADPAVEEVALEVGLGRMRVMSRDGLEDTAERWHDGPFGPDDDMATHAPANCLTCGFFLPLRGSLGVLFGACGNEYSPADGRVVDAGYGCGAHSEALTGVSFGPIVGETVVDELRLEVHDHPVRDVVLIDDDGSVGDLGGDLIERAIDGAEGLAEDAGLAVDGLDAADGWPVVDAVKAEDAGLAVDGVDPSSEFDTDVP